MYINCKNNFFFYYISRYFNYHSCYHYNDDYYIKSKECFLFIIFYTKKIFNINNLYPTITYSFKNVKYHCDNN